MNLLTQTAIPKSMLTPVRISDFGLYLRCPRLVYFDALGSLPRKVSPFNLLLRELILRISSDEDLMDQLVTGLAKLEQDLPLIYGAEIDPEELGLVAKEVEALIPGMAQGLADALDQILPSVVEVDLRSERLMLSGRLDRLVTEGHVPSIVRSGSAPDDGVWKRDRLLLAGYAMLAEEEYGIRIQRGQVEYPRSGVIRTVQIHSVDRGRLLRIRDRIQQIKEGRLPDRPEDARCDGCLARDKCETNCSLASKFF
jgi:CRISPR-associated exonuclease Cas4